MIDADPDIDIELSRGTRHAPTRSRDIHMSPSLTPSNTAPTSSSTSSSRPRRSRSRSSSQSPPPTLSPSSVPTTRFPPEVSIVEAADVTGVSFKPDLWMQRRAWALQVLRREGVRSVLDIGCGEGALLETLVVPPCSIHEPPILPSPESGNNQSECPETAPEPELFINRLAGLDISSSIVPRASEVLQPNPSLPRWEHLTAELWIGAIEKYNARLEGFDAITALELIEHLEPEVLSRFGVVTMGTYRPRVMLVSTPNFDFNAKFPRTHEYEQHGFVDPTGRTDRVFRHSDHKVEMTGEEFKYWALAAAADWGYEVELGGVGVSSIPSFYPSGAPIYATQTAIFRRVHSVPPRSPRSVRTISLPFIREAEHPHRQALKVVHPAALKRVTRVEPNRVRELVRGWFQRASKNSRASSGLGLGLGPGTAPIGAGGGGGSGVEGSGQEVTEVSVNELWPEVGESCAGSRRALFACLGGWGNVHAVAEPDPTPLSVRTIVKAVAGIGGGVGSTGSGTGEGREGKEGPEFVIVWKRDGWVVKWRGEKKSQEEVDGKVGGGSAVTAAVGGVAGVEGDGDTPRADTGGW